MPDLAARIHAKIHQGVARPPEECWPWGGATSEAGYPVITVTQDGRQKKIRVQRALYLLGGGQLGRRDEIGMRCHDQDEGCPCGLLCPHRACCNERHIYKVTRRGNPARRRRFERIKECPQKHPYTPGNIMRGSKGEIKCKTCHREQERRRRERQAARPR